jgi:adenylate kinase
MQQQFIELVAGVSGAGKTTLIEQMDDWTRVSGGTFVHERTPEIADRDALGNQSRAKIYADQFKMGAGMRQYLKDHPDRKRIIFDGRLFLVSPGGRVTPIVWPSYRECGLTGITFIEVDAREIFSRRQGDKTRDRVPETVQEIHANQELGWRICQHYARRGNLPLRKLVNPTADDLREVLTFAANPGG